MSYTTDEKIDTLFQSILELKNSIKSMSESHDRDFVELRKSQAETDRKFWEMSQETDRKLQESSDRFDIKFDRILSKFEEIWLVQWEFAEDSIKRSVKEDLANFGIDIHDIQSHIEWYKDGLGWEYDLVAINDKEIVVVEVKNKMNRKYLRRFVNTQLPRFKMFFPEFQDFILYGWVGAMVFDEDLEQEAEELWLFTFTQNGKNIRLNNSPNFKPKAFA